MLLPLLRVRWGIRLNKFLHCRNAFVDLFIRQGALFNKTLTEVIGRMLEHILPTIDNTLNLYVSGRITFFENFLYKARNVVPSGEAVAEEKHIQRLCRCGMRRCNSKKRNRNPKNH